VTDFACFAAKSAPKAEVGGGCYTMGFTHGYAYSTRFGVESGTSTLKGLNSLTQSLDFSSRISALSESLRRNFRIQKAFGDASESFRNASTFFPIE
ncbi:MAG: hypothetical protein U9N51_04285, partial [Bacteroidota bacterium]|nr:hypothetical protein [Bacteroidota bacterium]